MLKKFLESLEFYFDLNSKPEVIEVQKKLRLQGYDPGSIDGFFGSRTEEAVKDFQKAKDLTPTGIVDQETYNRLTSNTFPE